MSGKLLLSAIALCASCASLTLAPAASLWSGGPHSRVRLISASAASENHAPFLRAGVEIALQPGWKTYWRYPGDSGVSAQFDFSQSTNVRDVQVLWPAPVRFEDGGGTSIGYARDVILPLRVYPNDTGALVVLRAKLDYAICERLCVPVDAHAELTLGSGQPQEDEALRASEARVPQPAAVGQAGPLAIVGVSQASGTPPRVVVDVRAESEGAVDLFAEGPNADWSLPVPHPVADAPAGIRRFAFAIEGVPPGTTAGGAMLKLTAVSTSSAIEVQVRLD